MHPIQTASPRPSRPTSASRRLALATLAGACLAFASGPGSAAETIELKVSHYLPPNQTINQELTRWAADLATKSGGRLKVTIFPAGQMGPITRQFDLARTGVADAAFFLHGATPGRFPMTELMQLPYTFNPEKAGALQKPLNGSEASALATGFAPRLSKEYEGTRLLYLIASPNIGLYFNKAVVHKPADLKGMRIRDNGPMPAKMIEAWGATPASIAPVGLADALAKGTVNGMTFNYEAAQSFQLGGSIKSVDEINAYAVTFALVMNEKKYESLPADLKKLIDDSTGVEEARRVGAKYDEAEAAGRKYLLDNKVEIIVPTAEEQQAYKTPVVPLVNETLEAATAKGLPAKKFYDDLRARVNDVKR